MRFDVHEVQWEAVVVCDIPMLFTELRIKKDTVPEGLYMYEVRHADDDWGEPAQIADWVMANHFGTLLSNTALALEPNAACNNAYLDIDAELEWGYLGMACPVETYLSEEDDL